MILRTVEYLSLFQL